MGEVPAQSVHSVDVAEELHILSTGDSFVLGFGLGYKCLGLGHHVILPMTASRCPLLLSSKQLCLGSVLLHVLPCLPGLGKGFGACDKGGGAQETTDEICTVNTGQQFSLLSNTAPERL